jgi:hypothetical protein
MRRRRRRRRRQQNCKNKGKIENKHFLSAIRSAKCHVKFRELQTFEDRSGLQAKESWRKTGAFEEIRE